MFYIIDNILSKIFFNFVDVYSDENLMVYEILYVCRLSFIQFLNLDFVDVVSDDLFQKEVY